MKKALYLTLTLLSFVTLAFVPNSFTQDTQPENVVRVIYFLPKDRQPQQDIDTQLDLMMKAVHQSYAEVMENQGFGRKTFPLETDNDGKVVVHHVTGLAPDVYYHTEAYSKVEKEIRQWFDPTTNIYFVVLDVSTENIDGDYCGQGSAHGSFGGMSITPVGECLNVAVSAHELGHTFGLAHDRLRNANRASSSYHSDRMVRSFCAAEWLDVHAYFNVGENVFNENTQIQMLPSIVSLPNSVRIRFQITDADGLHQAQVMLNDHLITCQKLKGQSDTYEFEWIPGLYGISDHLILRVIDVHGNFTYQHYPIDIATLRPPKVVSIPDTNLATAIREALNLAPGDAFTERNLLKLINLDAENRQITDLTGLEHATQLQNLNLGGNQISDISPLASLEIVESLILSDNQISDISVLTGLENLTWLNLSGNQIRDLNGLTDLPVLIGLDLGGNQIRDITPFAGLTQLQNLRFWNNRISDITILAKLTNLTDLYLGQNSISDITPLTELTKLRYLLLDENPISDITPLTGLTDLEHLGLAGLQITDIRLLSKFMQLKSLYLHKNPISDITPVAELTELEHLGLAELQISDVTRFAKLTNLRTLYLDGNLISDITSLAALTNLEWLHLVGNQITDVRPLVRLTKLKRLRLARNPILDVSSLRTLLSRNLKLKLDVDTTQSPPVVQVKASERPGMYWIDTKNGTLHRLTSGKVERLVPSVENATGLAVDVAGGKLYWTEKTSEKSGRIRRANLKGNPNVRLIKKLTSVPLNIALDAAAGTLYLTNARGRIQRLNVDGSDFQPNLIASLEAPMEIALDVSGGKVYWTEMAGNIRRANLDGSNVETVASGLAAPTSIAIAGGNLYWTTQLNESAGKIQRANLKGSNIRKLATVPGSPEDIIVDNTGSRLYWANTLGGIQRSDLSGQSIQTLVTRLSSPTNLALSTAGTSVTSPIAKITGPWLWMIAPTKPNRGGKFSTNVDSLKVASRRAVTEAEIATNGAKAGDMVGSYAWTPGKIAETGSNNVNDLINRIGFVDGGNPISTIDDVDVEDHSAYAFITLRSARVQNGVTMRAGSDDSIKVWLNGKVVHRKRIDRGAVDFQDTFKVNLKRGDNLLLVKVSERAGHWSMFVGIDASVNIKQPLAAPTLSASEIAPPAETTLLTNYPNPFNPETWIPYQLSKPADVTLTIYAVNGQVVRRLSLGYQSAGIYQSRSRAAYWDGRNALGEPVASGVYFYTLTAGNFTATRKMLIRK